MKYIYLCLVGLLLFSSCKTATVPTANVVYQTTANGCIQARCIGLGDKQQTAIEDAEKNMLRTLLFRGLPGSGQETPMISTDEAQSEQNNPDYWNTMWGESKRYKTFIQASIPVSDLQKHSKGVYSMTVDVKVNIKALRMDLEKQGLIRRFGF